MITASKVGAILGLSPYQSRTDVLRAMVRTHHGAEREFKGNALTRYGVAHEQDAIADYERLTGVMTHSGQQFIVHPVYDWLGATPDALVGDDGLAETKCPPPRSRYTHVDQRPDYHAQISLQLECTQRKWGDLVVWRGWPPYVSRVDYTGLWLESILPDLEAFKAEYERIIADPELSAPYLTPLVDVRDDEAWQSAAVDYLEALAELNAAERPVEAARGAILRLADGRNARGSGVSVTYAERRGRVNYTAALTELAPSADLDKYRGKSTTVATVRTTTSDRGAP